LLALALVLLPAVFSPLDAQKQDVFDKINNYLASGGMDDPLLEIRAANALIRMGPKRGPAMFEQYLKERWGMRVPDEIKHGPAAEFAESMFPDPNERMIGLIRFMYEPPKDGFMPVPMIGHLSPAPPKDLRKAPRYPWIVVGDIPFNMEYASMGSGLPESTVTHFQLVRRACKFRERVYRPSDDPIHALHEATSIEAVVEATPVWEDFPRTPGAAATQMELQFLNLVHSVYKPLSAWNAALDGRWHEVEHDFAKLRVKWDSKKEDYVLLSNNGRSW